MKGVLCHRSTHNCLEQRLNRPTRQLSLSLNRCMLLLADAVADPGVGARGHAFQTHDIWRKAVRLLSSRPSVSTSVGSD